MKNKNYFKKALLALVILIGFTNFVNAQIPNYVPTNGLVAYYPFNGNVNDESGNGNNCTNIGANITNDRFGDINKAYNFLGGSSSYLQTPISNFTTSNFSICAWAKATNNVPNSSIIASRIAIDRLTGFGLDNSFNYFYIATNSTSYNTQSLSNFVDNTWHFYCVIYNNGIMQMYVDNILKGQDNQNLTPQIIAKFKIGLDDLTTFGIRGFEGDIDDIGFWNRALTQDEITNLYNANLCYQSSFIINTGLLSYNPPTYNNTITIYPNPANDHITIDCGTIANVVGYHIEIANSLGQVVFNKTMNTQQYTVALNTWSGQVIYFVKVYDANNTLLTTRKLILQ